MSKLCRGMWGILWSVFLFFMISCMPQLHKIHTRSTDATFSHLDTLQQQFFIAKVKVHVQSEQGNNTKMKLYLKAVQNKGIFVSFSQVGITGGKCMITPENIIILNVLKKKVYTLTYEELSMRMGIDFNYSILQSLFNQSLLLNTKPESTDRDSLWHLNQVYDKYSLNYLVDKQQHILEQIDILSSADTLLSLQYKERKSMLQGKEADANIYSVFPFLWEAYIRMGKPERKHMFKLSMEYTKVEVPDKEPKMYIRIPKRYEQASF